MAKKTKTATPVEAPVVDAGYDITTDPEARVRIIIRNAEGPGGKDRVFIGHNGELCSVAREVPVEIKQKFLWTLNAAVMTLMEQVPDPRTGNLVMVETNVPRHNVTVLGYVPEKSVPALAPVAAEPDEDDEV